MLAKYFQEGQIKQGRVDKIAYGGDGIIRLDGFPFFVPRVAPGDEVEFEIRDVRKRYGKGVPKKILKKSSDRIEPKCSYYSECGGCHTQHLDRTVTLETYKESIDDALRKFGPGTMDIQHILEAKDPWHYRNRVTYQRKDGAQGYVRWTDYSVVDIERCPIAHEDLNDLWSFLRPRVSSLPETFLPYVVLRRTAKGHQAALFSVSSLGQNKDTEDLEKTILELPENVSAFVTEVPRHSKTPFGKSIDFVRGKERFDEEICGTTFSVYPDIFFQVHTEMAEELVRAVKKWTDPLDEKILDVFCGAGLFTLPLAQDGKRVLGVEVNHRSIQCAEESISKNLLKGQARFRTGKAERILERLYREGERFETAIVDPPRKGLQKGVIENLLQLGIRNLAYVSCSPPTMARDLKLLVEKGFEISPIQPFEMFPQTYHIETLTFLHRM